MKKRTSLIITLHVIVVIVLVAALVVPHIELIPSGGHASFQNMTIIMTKVDPNGNELGKWTVTMDGKTQHYSTGKLSLDIKVSAFDDITGITLHKNGITQIHGELQSHWNGYHYLQCSASPSGDQWWLAFEDNLDRWALFRSPGEPFYVGYWGNDNPNLTARYTVEELIEFFDLGSWIAD